MGIPEATKKQLRNEVICTLRKNNCHFVDCGCVCLLTDIMETVCKAWIFGRDTGYREARDEEN